jgi:hypothetical protein
LGCETWISFRWRSASSLPGTWIGRSSMSRRSGSTFTWTFGRAGGSPARSAAMTVARPTTPRRRHGATWISCPSPGHLNELHAAPVAPRGCVAQHRRTVRLEMIRMRKERAVERTAAQAACDPGNDQDLIWRRSHGVPQSGGCEREVGPMQAHSTRGRERRVARVTPSARHERLSHDLRAVLVGRRALAWPTGVHSGSEEDAHARGRQLHEANR